MNGRFTRRQFSIRLFDPISSQLNAAFLGTTRFLWSVMFPFGMFQLYFDLSFGRFFCSR